MPDSVPYVKPSLEGGDVGYRLKCECGAYMSPTWGKRTDDGRERDFVWHVCEREPGHITKEIEISPGFRSTFTKSG
jgi:hypothetical protein